jgi:hypothetical protein
MKLPRGRTIIIRPANAFRLMVVIRVTVSWINSITESRWLRKSNRKVFAGTINKMACSVMSRKSARHHPGKIIEIVEQAASRAPVQRIADRSRQGLLAFGAAVSGTLLSRALTDHRVIIALARSKRRARRHPRGIGALRVAASSRRVALLGSSAASTLSFWKNRHAHAQFEGPPAGNQ